MLVETTTVDRLVSSLKSGSYRSSQDIRQKSHILLFVSSPKLMFCSSDWISLRRWWYCCRATKNVIKMSSTCCVRYLFLFIYFWICIQLSFMRINTPCRSSRCVHSQCFDATSWFSVMEQTTTWLCPVCERVLDCKDLIIDGCGLLIGSVPLY